MPNWKFWERQDDTPREPVSPEQLPALLNGVPLPQPRSDRGAAVDPAASARLTALERRRTGMLYDLERAEAATRPQNPWRERMALLEETRSNVIADLAALDVIPPEAPYPLPPVPITDIAVEREEPLTVRFRIGPERFVFSEEIDWNQRGGPVVRGDLRQREGDATKLVPADAPIERRESLARHLSDSIAAYAVWRRDHELEGQATGDPPTLADLAEPCPVCGNWREWGGVCSTCAARAYQRQQLQLEAARLETERDQEEEERHKWAERLPLARRRLADLDAEIAKLAG